MIQSSSLYISVVLVTTEPLYTTCDPHTEFECSILQQCIDVSRKCDNKIDCWDHSDESNATCHKNICDMFRCKTSQRRPESLSIC